MAMLFAFPALFVCKLLKMNKLFVEAAGVELSSPLKTRKLPQQEDQECLKCRECRIGCTFIVRRLKIAPPGFLTINPSSVTSTD